MSTLPRCRGSSAGSSSQGSCSLSKATGSSYASSSAVKTVKGGISVNVGCPSRTVSGVVKRRKHLVLLGLDGSGKTTILMRLKYRTFVDTAPTIGFNHEKIWGGGFRWSAWDVGGGERVRPLWATYSRAMDGLVFVVNSSSPPDGIEEARVELAKVIKASRTNSVQLGRPLPPLLVLANFQDQPTARGKEEVAQCLGLREPWASGVTWDVAPVCGITGDGLDEAMALLRSLIDKVKQESRKKEKPIVRWRY